MLRAGLIGLPSTGKSTLFQLLTRRDAGAAGRFGRAETEIGVSTVPDERLARLADLFQPNKFVPATVTFVDVVGAPQARSLLDAAAYRDANTLLHVIRAFDASDVPHVELTIDPARDARTVEDELILADLVVAEKRLERLKHDRKKGVKANIDRETDVLETCRRHLEAGRPLRAMDLDLSATKILRGFQFLSAKPLLVVINVDESRVGSREDTLTALAEILEKPDTRGVVVCAKIELEIAELDSGDAKEFLADIGLDTPGLTRIIRATYDLLGYISFFTVGPDECRAWSIPRGTMAHQAAGEIHSDIERGFIRAEVVGFTELLDRGSLTACRDHGEVRLEGKEYVVQDGDVINFRFAT